MRVARARAPLFHARGAFSAALAAAGVTTQADRIENARCLATGGSSRG